MLWYEQACKQQGQEKMLDLQISIAPHAERPDQAVQNLQRNLQQMMELRDG